MTVPAPEHLSVAERALWDATVRLITVELTPTKCSTLEAYCVERARWLAADAFLREHGDVLVLRNEKGDVVGSKEAPQLRIARSARETALRLGRKLKIGDPADEGDGQRNTLGQFQPGNLAAVSHALRSDRLPPEFEHLRAEVEAFADESISDDGGVSEVATRRRTLHEYRGRIHRRILQLDAAIELRGLFDKRGKLRVAWLQRLEALIATARGIDNLLGLNRRQKAATSPLDYIEGRAEI